MMRRWVIENEQKEKFLISPNWRLPMMRRWVMDIHEEIE
jgi:hypothetical protein